MPLMALPVALSISDPPILQRAWERVYADLVITDVLMSSYRLEAQVPTSSAASRNLAVNQPTEALARAHMASATRARSPNSVHVSQFR